MALSVSEPTSSVASTLSSTTYSLAAFTPTAGHVLILYATLTASNITGDPATVSNTGTTLDWIAISAIDNGADQRQYVWYTVVPSSVSSSAITVNFGGGKSCTGGTLQIQSWSGAYTGGPIKQAVTATGAATTSVSLTRTAIQTNNGSSLCLGSVYAFALSTAPNSSGGAYTSHGLDPYLTPTSYTQHWSYTGTDTGTTVSLVTVSNLTYVATYIEVVEASNGKKPALLFSFNF